MKPEAGEFLPYYGRYIDQVAPGDVLSTLANQMQDTQALLKSLPASVGKYRYAPDKWSIRQVVGHVNDAERLFVFRAVWFARGFDSSLPSFDQDVAVASAGSDERSWASLIDEFQTIRAASLSFFKSLPDDAWMKRGIASGNPFTVRALAYIVAGHVAHHVGIVRERYL